MLYILRSKSFQRLFVKLLEFTKKNRGLIGLITNNIENWCSKLVKEMVTNRFHFKMLFCLQQARILAILYFSKTATALKTRKFSDINISQGSVVKRFRCDEIFNDSFIANFQEIVKVKKIVNRCSNIFKERWEKFYTIFFCSSPLTAAAKELLKSIHIRQSYSKIKLAHFYGSVYNFIRSKKQ